MSADRIVFNIKENAYRLITAVDFEKGIVAVGGKEFSFSPLPAKLMEIFEAKGLVNYVKNK